VYKQCIQGKRVTVIGAARSGVAASLLLRTEGAEVCLTDRKENPAAAADLARLQQAGIETRFGSSGEAPECDWLVISPGVPVSSPAVTSALSRNIPVFGELEVASWFSASPIAAVTGSNGKTTTAALLAAMVRAGGKPCVLAGNIGESFASKVRETVSDGAAVLEVSSFQLETIHTFHPAVSVILNLSPDHLDRHGTMEEYGRMKANIFKNQQENDLLVYNADDRLVAGLAGEARCLRRTFSAFPGSGDAFIREEALWMSVDGREEMLVKNEQMQLPGEHNRLNALAASLAAAALHIPVTAIRETLKSFTSLPHRLEYVRTLDGVAYINDSKATNVDAVWYALGGYTQPVILIAGGRDKDSDFTLLRSRVQERVKALVLIGEASGKLAKSLEGTAEMVKVNSLSEAVAASRQLASPGDVVLLSPACASFDMFRSYEDRGDQFRNLVREL